MSSVLPKGVPLPSLAVDASARFCDADCTADARETLRALGREGLAQHPCIGPDRAEFVLPGCAIFAAIQQRWPAPEYGSDGITALTLYLNKIAAGGELAVREDAVAQVGLGANLPEDAIYPLNLADESGKPLDGTSNYTIHFDKGATPPAQAFWSITLYDQDGFQVGNDGNSGILVLADSFPLDGRTAVLFGNDLMVFGVAVWRRVRDVENNAGVARARFHKARRGRIGHDALAAQRQYFAAAD